MSTSAQQRIKQLVLQHLGEDVFWDEQERAMRCFEEATELAQSVQVPLIFLMRILERAYDKPMGATRQEVGGVLVTILAFCERQGWDYKTVLQEEILRFAENGPKIKAKHNEKVEAGTSMKEAK